MKNDENKPHDIVDQYTQYHGTRSSKVLTTFKAIKIKQGNRSKAKAFFRNEEHANHKLFTSKIDEAKNKQKVVLKDFLNLRTLSFGKFKTDMTTQQDKDTRNKIA